MSRLMELADAYALERQRGIFAPSRTDEARAALAAEIEKVEAENARLQQQVAQLKRVDALGEAMFNVQLRTDLSELEAENAKLKHNVHVLTDALWKSCGDDEETVNATIDSQGELK